MRVLITGAGGWTAVSIIQTLYRKDHTMIGFDLRKPHPEHDILPSLDKFILGDVAEYPQVEEAVQNEGVEAIIHLAVAVGEEDYQTPEIPFATNVKGTYNVFDAARKSGVKKVVHLSSASVHLMKEGTTIVMNALVDWESSSSLDHLYDLTKRLQEEIAKDFSQTFGMQVVVLRTGHIVDGRKKVDAKGRPLASLDYCRGGWVCRYDLARACEKALELSSPGYSAFHIIGSKGANRYFDIDRTVRELNLNFEEQFE